MIKKVIKFIKNDIVKFSVLGVIILATYFFVNKLQITESKRLEGEMLSLYGQTIQSFVEQQKINELRDEKLAETKMKTYLYEIEDILLKKEKNEMNIELLNQIKEEYKINDISILKKDGEEIYIANSTDKQEIGVKTSSWGYWYEAFSSLFNKEIIGVDKGYQINSFWVGPRSFKYSENGDKKYYKFAYLYSEEGDYLINLIWAEEEYITSSLNIDSFINTIKTKNKYVDKLGIINLDKFIEYIENTYGQSQDPIFEHGSFNKEILIKNNKYLLDMKETNRFVVDISSEIENKHLYLEKINDNWIIVSIIDSKLFKVPYGKFFVYNISIIFIGVAIFIYVMYKYIRDKNNLLKVQESQKRDLEQLNKSLLYIPSFVMRIKRDKDFYNKIVYVEGNEVDKIFKGMSIKKENTFEKWVSKDFLDDNKNMLNEAFLGKTKRFIYKIFDKTYEIMLIPVEDKKEEIIIFAYNIDKYIEKQSENMFLAYHDILTGLGNRHQFEKDFIELEHKKDIFYVLYMDMNKFKKLNDLYGHDFGDKVLKEVGKRFSKINNSKIHCYRFGGDEFVALVEESDVVLLVNILNTIIKSIDSFKELDNKKLELGVSIGVSKYPDQSKYAEDLLRIADQAMYHVKHLGVSAYKISIDYSEN